MANTSNFREAIRKSQGQVIIGPNVISNALPYVGGGLILTAVGVYGGLGVLNNYPELFMPTFLVAIVAELALFFVARGIAEEGNNSTALPLLATYGLLSGYTLSGLIAVALTTPGVGLTGIGVAALSCGITFIAARQTGSSLSEEDGIALSQTVRLGILALFVVLIAQLLFSFFGVITPSWLEISISALGVLLFVGAAVVDFFVLPRAYKDEQYLPAALSMYLTYINLFVFILRLLISLNSRD
jgi:FtsH-binding integral membrane protein